MDAEILKSMDVAAENLAALGHEVIEGVAPYDLAEINHTWSVLSSAGAARAIVSHADWKKRSVLRSLKSSTEDFLSRL